MDKRLFFLMNMAQHKLYKHVDQRCEKTLGITVTQVAAMFLLAKNEGCLLKELSQSLSLNNSAVTGLANRMEKNGLIRKQPCENDGRASRIFLTALGKSKLTTAFPLLQEMNDAITEEFTNEEIDTVVRFLNHLITRF